MDYLFLICNRARKGAKGSWAFFGNFQKMDCSFNFRNREICEFFQSGLQYKKTDGLLLEASKGKRPEDLERFMECLFTIPDSDIPDNIITRPDFSTSANTFSNPSPVSKKSNLRVNVTQTKLLMDS